VEHETVPTPALQLLLQQFGKSLLETYEWKIVTAYTHILVAHTTAVMNKFGNIPKFSQEGFEGANKFHKRIAERATNHTKTKSLLQQILHIYRLIY